MVRSLMALTLVVSLSLGSAFDAFAQTSQHKRKPKKPKAAPCVSGCKPEITQPNLAADTPEDEAAQKELAELARAVHTGVPGSYEKLSAFAVKNTTSTWGARAALALGYEDYSKNRNAQALGWLLKAQNDTLLREYALYWTAETQRLLGRSAEAYKVLQSIQSDYPNTAMREQFLLAFAPVAV
jgi:outer membrane protein assembly factor BamD (BamD/ComL family)